MKLVPPTLTSLVLAVPLLALLVRSGVIPVMTLLSGLRTPLENVSGAVVLAALFGASAQALNLLIPDTGLLHAAFAIFVFCQLLTMGAATVNRPATLRGLLVLFGSLFVLRYILVEALYASDGGLMQRVLTTLMSGASLGGISYEPERSGHRLHGVLHARALFRRSALAAATTSPRAGAQPAVRARPPSARRSR